MIYTISFHGKDGFTISTGLFTEAGSLADALQQFAEWARLNPNFDKDATLVKIEKR